jgi:hypothetical protein
MFKNELIEFIRKDYQELKELEVEIEGVPLKGTLYNLLTPYLAHKNTIDNQNRVISFYTREGSKQQKLLPFYIGLSNYYKAFSEIKSEYSDAALEDNSLEIALNSIIDELPTEFNYLNKKWHTKELTIDIEKNNRIHLFIESVERFPRSIAPRIQDILPNLKKYIKNFSDLEDKVHHTQVELNTFLEENDEFLKFKQIRDSSESKIGIYEILKLGNTINLSPAAGVLLFTNKTKYRKLIESTFINGKPITDTFTIAEIKFKTNGEIEVVNDGDNRPIIFYCSSDYYGGWQEIVEELGVDYVNTIVIDDFDSILNKEIRSDFEFFRDFAESINTAQKTNKLKDVYFLDEDSNFHNSKYLEKFNLDFYPWLLNYQERSSLIGKNTNENCHKTISISDEFGSKFWSRFKTLVLQLNSISKFETNLENKAWILTLLRKGYDFLSRITSFYHPEIKFELRDYLKELRAFNEELESISLKDKIQGLAEVIESNLLTNDKIRAISSIIMDGGKSKSVIISKNNSSIDKKEAQRIILEETNQEVEFIGLEELRPSTLGSYDNAFFLHFSGKYTRTLFLSKFCKNQFIVLNNKSETGYYRKCFQNFAPKIIELSDFDNKLILLNLEEQEELIERNKIEYHFDEYIEYKVEEFEDSSDSNSEDVIEEEVKDIEEQDFSYVIEKMLQSDEGDTSKSSSGSQDFTSYLILFEKSFVKAPEWKHFHVMEDYESTYSNDHKKKVSELNIGDKVFVMEGFNNDFNELLTFLKNEYVELAKHFDVANSWRLDLINQYEAEGGFYTKLNSFLKTNGVVVSNPTVEKWVSGMTIMPDSLPQLIEIFRKHEYSYSSRYPSEEIINSTRWLAKFRTSLHKEIFQYHVYKKYGMFQQIRNLKLKSLIEKMEDIVSIQEIIMIQKQ